MTLLLLLCTPLLGGCAGEATKGVAEAAGLATTAQEAKSFVQATRKDSDYIPVGSSATRAAARKTPEEFQQLEAALEAKRGANDAAGQQARRLGATPPPAPATIPVD